MTQIAACSGGAQHKSALFFLVLTTGLLTGSWPARVRHCNRQAGGGFEVSKYLPQGAKIRDDEKDVVFADLCGNGRRDIVIFYTIGESSSDNRAAILVLKPSGTNYKPLWQEAYDGSWGFASPSGVYDLNGTGTPQIIAYRTIGASCPGVLEIYECVGETIRRITGHWADNGQCQSVKLKDLNGDGIPEVIVRTRNYGVNEDIYRWTSGHYVKSDGQFPKYYDSELQELVKEGNSGKQLPASWRLSLAQQAIEIYLIQKRSSTALNFCSALLATLRDPKRTKEDVPRAQATASAYRLMAKVYLSRGEVRMAHRYQSRADALAAPDR
jgi:hypothetical protein